MMGQPHGLPFLGVIGMTGQHHFGHAAGTDDAGDADRTAAADENPAAALGQGVEGGRFGHPHMGRCRQFQAAADHGALQGGHHRQAAHLDMVEGAMPLLGVQHHLEGFTVAMLGQIEAGREMGAVAVQHDDARRVRGGGEEVADLVDEGIVDGVALVGSVEPDHGDGAAHLDGQKGIGTLTHAVPPQITAICYLLKLLCATTISAESSLRLNPANQGAGSPVW